MDDSELSALLNNLPTKRDAFYIGWRLALAAACVFVCVLVCTIGVIRLVT